MTDPRPSAPPTSGSSGDSKPVPAPSAPAPAPLARAAFERVLARAAELQAGGAEPAEQMSEEQLIEVGKEVGIGPEHVRLALAEERTRVQLPEEKGVIGGMFGAPGITASRVVRGTPADLLARLDEWMQREEGLRPMRRFGDRMTWEARKDLLGSLQQGLNFGGRAYGLRSSNEVGATVVAIDAERCMVRLDASFEESRRNHVIGGAVAAGTGVLGFGGMIGLATLGPSGSLALGALVGLVPVLAGSGITYAVARTHRRKIQRAQLSLEQVLDRLERGELRRANPLSPLTDFIDVVSRRVERSR